MVAGGRLPPRAAQDQIGAVAPWSPSRDAAVDLEFHQLDCRYEALRVRQPERERRLLASLADHGQQMPIVVVRGACAYVVVDGHKRPSLRDPQGGSHSQPCRGRWNLSELWTRTRTRAYKLLGRRPTDAGVHSYHRPRLPRSIYGPTAMDHEAVLPRAA